MKFLTALLLLPLLFFGAASQGAEEDSKWEIRAQNNQGEVEYDPATGIFSAPKGVIFTYHDVVLTAERVTANQQTGDVHAEGSVTVKGRDHLWSGERVDYNFKTGEVQADTFKTGHDPFYISGQGLHANLTNKTYSVTNAFITTDNYAEPSHRIRARQLTFVPGKYFEARNATLYAGDVPVFFYPYYHRSLRPHPNNFSFLPGYRSLYGPYLLSTYNWFGNENVDGSIHLDLRERRGVGGGPDFNLHLGKFGEAEFKYYLLKDQDPEPDQNLRPVPETRQRLSFTHQALLSEGLSFKTAVRYQSDPSVVRDFFESEYRKNIQPNTFVEANKLWSNWSLDLLVQPRVNDFFETVERLPDIKLTGLRQQLGATPLYYESDSSLGYYHRKFADNVFPEFSAYRADSFQQITLPRNFFGWLNFTPRVGGRFTYYSEADGAGATTLEQKRGVFNTGAELSVKSSRVWKNAQSKFFDVNELRHIIEPSVNYAWVPSPNVLPSQLPQFDYEVPSLRLLPIEFPEYNAIDSIDSENVLRFTLLNRLQTKRADGVENLVHWAVYADWNLRPRASQNTFSDLYSDLTLRPRTWFNFHSQTRFDIGDGRWREANHRMIFQPNSAWSVSVGHRYLANDPALGPNGGHNLIYDRVYYRFNENWAARMSHYFEARDGVMEEQYYTLYRDLRNWTAALSFRHRQNRVGRPDDYTIAISISLKFFPRALNSDNDRPETLVGG